MAFDINSLEAYEDDKESDLNIALGSVIYKSRDSKM